ncbi:hypothetical protein WDB88_17835 (plasmid) [Thioclava sp. GXIMD4216]
MRGHDPAPVRPERCRKNQPAAGDRGAARPEGHKAYQLEMARYATMRAPSLSKGQAQRAALIRARPMRPDLRLGGGA